MNFQWKNSNVNQKDINPYIVRRQIFISSNLSSLRINLRHHLSASLSEMIVLRDSEHCLVSQPLTSADFRIFIKAASIYIIQTCCTYELFDLFEDMFFSLFYALLLTDNSNNIRLFITSSWEDNSRSKLISYLRNTVKSL